MDYADIKIIRDGAFHMSWLIGFPPKDYLFKSNAIKLITSDSCSGYSWRLTEILLIEYWFVVVDSGKWTSLAGVRGMPVNVQEHSMVFYRDNLYVFGGLFSHPDECPLWIYRTQVLLSTIDQNLPPPHSVHISNIYRNKSNDQKISP